MLTNQDNKRPLVIKLSGQLQYRLLMISTALLGVHALTPHGANAAGFMDKSLANFTKINGLPEGIKDMVRTVGAVSYLIPPLVILGCGVAIVMASQHSEGAASKAKVASMVIILTMAILWIYDASFVGVV